jgi:hypothetical protein
MPGGAAVVPDDESAADPAVGTQDKARQDKARQEKKKQEVPEFSGNRNMDL